MLTGQEALYISNGGTGQTAMTLDEIAAYISAQGFSVAWADITGKPATFAPTVGTGAADALAGNTPILSAGAITAIAALSAASTAAEIVAALQTAG